MISGNAAFPGSYDYGEVARSVFIAIAASYAALGLAGRVTAARGRVRLAWLSGGATAMGIGIWAMHLKGMLAFHLPVAVEYHWPTVLASLSVAIFASAVALYVSSRRKMGWVEAFTGSVIMGAGIAGMHYIGMAAMRLPATTLYSPLLVTCSILLAILFSLIALLMAFDLREEARWTVPRRLASATVMGLAVSAMHYTGMAAASFVPSPLPDLSHAVNISPLANNGIAIVTLIVIVAAMVTSSVERRAHAEIQGLNEDLERRVAERTLQLEAVNQELRKEIAERQRAEDAVRHSEEHLRLVIDTAPAMLHSARPDGYVDYFNKRWLDFVGVSLERISGWGWTTVIHPDDVEEVVSRWRSSVATGKPFEAEARLRRADGEYRLMLLRKVPLRDETGSIVKWYGSATDIEDRKRAEDELRKQKEVFQKIFESIPVMIVLLDPRHSHELVNPEWERTIGWTLAEIQEQNPDIFAEAFPDPQYRQMVMDDIAASTGEWTDLKVRVRDGRVIDVNATFVYLSDGSTLFIGRDVTGRKRAEAKLRESEARFRLVADSAPVMIWMSGTDKLCTYFNKPWLDFTGRSVDQELGNGWAEDVHPDDLRRCMATYLQSFDRREEFMMEYRLRRHDGEFRLIYDIGVPRFNPDGSFAGYIGSCLDVTEQRRAEEQLRQTQDDLARVTRVVAMGELAAAIAHEVNQPLTAIVTNANFSLRQLKTSSPNLDELRAAIAEIVNDGSRASAVISRIRGMLTKGSRRRAQLDVNEIIQQVITLLRNELTRNHVSFHTELAADLPPVQGDPVELQQVLINLVMNALEAMRLAAKQSRNLLIRSAMNHDAVLVQIQDSGPGIEPEVAGHIFEPFFTTKPEGTGMGLAISRSIVESHGGELSVVTDHQGALFQFVLPVDRREAA